MTPFRLLIGGSPCTHWSIAGNKRETTASGIGYELFRNYVIAKERFLPHGFLYENVHSASPAIKAQINHDLGGVQQAINSALVSAQQRWRIYQHSAGLILPPEDRGILLKDILESGCAHKDKSYTLTARTGSMSPADIQNCLAKSKRMFAAELVATLGDDHRQNRVHSLGGKSVALMASTGGGTATGLYAVPVCVAQRGRYNLDGSSSQKYEARPDQKTNALTTVEKNNLIAEPVIFNFPHGYNAGGIKYDKSPTLTTSAWQNNNHIIEPVPACLRYERNDYAKEIRSAYESGQVEARRCDMRELHPRGDGKSNTLTTVLKDNMIIELAAGRQPIYEVKDGQITVKGKTYPIALPDGYYIIRKLSVVECCRLQTMPDDYFLYQNGDKIISDTQAYKCLGNGWTADVIIHLLEHILAGVAKDYPIEVLSLYDGIGTGRYCLNKMGYSNIKYHAYEIDKYACAVASANYPDIIHLGDAFDVRKSDWLLDYNPHYVSTVSKVETVQKQLTIEDFLEVL
jgi:DNA (cytosine-5)-methyltransferase 3A